jgi:hypothetical protein
MELAGKHAVKHVKKKSTQVQDVEIQFSGHISACFRELAESVRNDSRYNEELKPVLERLASGEQMTIISAIARIGTTTEEASRYIQVTSNKRTAQALHNVLGELEASALEIRGAEKAVIQVTAKGQGREA